MTTKILLMNIPSGTGPSDYPPVAISRVIEGLDPALACETEFLDLDYSRASFEEIKEKIGAFSPQIIGFSAVVTVSYAYLKKLSLFVKKYFPEAIQVLGGEMAVISNIVVQRTGVDFCVTGEAEPTFSNLIRKLQQDNFSITDKSGYETVKGLVFMSNASPYFTGYEDESRNEIREINYQLLSKFTDADHYLPGISGAYYRNRISDGIEYFFRLFYPQNLNKKTLTVFASNGCSNRCTFCHRFFKGYRSLDPEVVINYIERNKDKYGIGMVSFMEEDFGENRQATARITDYLKETGLNWATHATKVKTLNDDILKIRKNSGCVYIGLGIESCSEKMLTVMDKRTTVEENLNVLRLLNKHKITTVLGILLGMPGESDATVEETLRNLSTVIPDDINSPYEICVNYYLAVPGTQGYEFARRAGLIGQSLDEEERYIENLFNADIYKISHYLNFTDMEIEETAYWKDYILLELVVVYMRKHGILRVLKIKKAKRYRYGLVYMMFPRAVRKILLKYFVIIKHFGTKSLLSILYRKIAVKRTKKFEDVRESLRKVNQRLPMPVRADDASTFVLREGR